MLNSVAVAAPHVPTDDSEVLQSGLPGSDPRMMEIRALAGSLAEHPDDPDLRLQLAVRQLALGVAESDPRFVGYAQGTLAIWWSEPNPPPKIRVVRARILQAQHDFVRARGDLQAVIAADPTEIEALLVLASIDQATGELEGARNACEALARQRPSLATTACAAGVDSVTGHADAAYRTLLIATLRAPARDPQLQCWALTILAEIAERRDDPAADRHFADALAVSPGDVYALTAYADYLLAHGRAREVSTLLAGKERIDALLLRLALAARDTGDPKLDGYIEELSARYAAARARGEALHLRDEAVFELELRHDPHRAVDLARQNWAIQRSPIDARVLLATAQADHDQATIQVVAKWVMQTGLEDFRLRQPEPRTP